MDNANAGGNRGTFNGGQPEVFGAPESFDKAFSNTPSFNGVEQDNGQKNNSVPAPVTPEAIQFSDAETSADIGNAPEVRPLAMDGTTEGNLGKLALRLSGEELDEASAKEVKQKITELKDKPYELQNYRDEAMVEFLRDSFGRIFGNNNEGGQDESDR